MCGCFSRVSPFCVDIGGCESGAGYMEAPQLSPGDGERPGVPGALEAGGDADPSGGHETAYHGDDGTQGTEDNGWPYDAGAPRFQRPPARDPRARSDGTPRARYDEGAGGSQGPNDSRSGQSHGVPRSRDDEGPRSWDDEGPRSRDDEGPRSRDDGGPRSRSDEGSRGRSDEGPRGRSDQGPRGRSDEGPRNDEATDGPSRCKGTSTISTEGTRARNDETTLCPNFSEGPQSASTEGPRARNETFDGPACSEGPQPASSEGPRAWNDKSTVSPGCSKGPQSAASEGPRAWDDETAGGPSHSKGPRSASNEGPRDVAALASCNEEPSRPSDAFPNDADEPDQWPTRGPEGSNGAQSRNEGLNDVSPAQCYDAGATDPPEHGKGGHGSGVLEGAESFKKPLVPCRSSWNEKTLEQRIKRVNAAPSPQLSDPVSSSREAAPDVRTRLPPDSSGGGPALPYEEPPWAGWPAALYTLEALKSGSILSTKSLSGVSWTLFGRLPTCHVPLEHPSVSRYHAVLQYRAVAGSESHEEPGFYVYDLGSTHGTFINKQRIQAKTFCRFRVGHVLKFGGSSRLFILQGPDEDQDAESELTVTQIKEARRQKESLQKRMLGDDSDEDEEEGEEKEQKQQGGSEDGSCTWGMGEDAEDEETDVNPIVVEYQAEREALYSANPKKALQGFFDREGEELDFEYEERGIGSWLCRVKLPADDSSGKQLLAEVVHSGKKRDAMKLCCLEACRMLDMRGLLRQEAVSRKRKAKRWEAEDFYDSDDDTFLDRTGVVEKKRLSRMKKAGKIEEKPETYESLTAKLDLVEKEIVEVAAKLKTNRQGDTPTSSQDSLDAFMTEIRSGASVDGVTRRKLHLQSLELKKEQQRLKSLIKMVQPTRLPELKADSAGEHSRTKKLTLPMFGAMKGGSKFKLKTGTVGRLPPKRTDLPSSLFTMKGDNDEPEEEEEDEECDMLIDTTSDSRTESKAASRESTEQRGSPDPETCTSHAADVEEKIPEPKRRAEAPSASRRTPRGHSAAAALTEEKVEKDVEPKATSARPKRVLGPGRPPPGALQANYPEDDPDYCVWSPPAGQTGDGKTHLNEKYGY